MAATHREGELAFTFPPHATKVIKFDDPATHRASVMKAVDFIVEFPDHDLYVEVKDADNSEADEARRRAFLEKLSSGKLEGDLTYKYRDSLLYRWCQFQPGKPIRYVVLLELATLQDRDYQLWTDKLKRRLPLVGPPSWLHRMVERVWVMNAERWNRTGVFGTVSRQTA